MTADPALYRILDALKPFDGPRGSIELSASDAAWLFDHLRSVEIESDSRAAAHRPPDNRHLLWIALDVAMQPHTRRKAAIGSVAAAWGVTHRQAEDWERQARGAAHELLAANNRDNLSRIVAHHREHYRANHAS